MLPTFAWTMESKIKIETVLTGIATVILLAFLMIIPLDIIEFYNDQETYEKIYQLNVNKENWQWDYLGRWVYMALLTITGLTVIALGLIKNESEKFKKINWTFLVIFFGCLILKFYTWMKTPRSLNRRHALSAIRIDIQTFGVLY